MALWSVVEEARKERDAAIERAENAESTIKETNGQLNRYGEALRALWALLPKELIVQGASVVDQTRKHISELTERAEKAETYSAEISRALHVHRVDERARFERETAARLLAGFVTRDPMPKDAFERAASGAAIAADHYFGAKEAKG